MRVLLDTHIWLWALLEPERIDPQDAPVTREIAIRSREVGLDHDDPADRFLAATAAVYDLVLMTADDRLREGSGYRVFD